jgi:hypothetical protein
VLQVYLVIGVNKRRQRQKVVMLIAKPYLIALDMGDLPIGLR